MKADELLDAALGRREQDVAVHVAVAALDGPTSADLDLTNRLDRLRRNLNALLDDGAAIEPPPDLARRTVQFVLNHTEVRSRRVLQFEQARSSGPRWADFAVAAGIFLAGLITLIPAIQRGQFRTRQLTCAFNLNRLGVALRSIRERTASTPTLTKIPPPPAPGRTASCSTTRA